MSQSRQTELIEERARFREGKGKSSNSWVARNVLGRRGK
jgi:hypothetical protein